MREILFKAKQKVTGKWVIGDLRQDHELGEAYIFGWKYYVYKEELQREPFEYEADTETVCMYTGLNDKNISRIWEGDILKIVSGGIDEEDGFFIVKWDNNGARFILESDSLLTDFDHIYGTNCEVIGNIFDNPELIKGEDDDRE